MTKTISWLSIMAIAAVLIAGLIAVNPVAIADDDDDDNGDDVDLIVTETVNLQGKLRSGDFKLLIDTTPVVFDTGHAALKVPCDENGDTTLAILAGIAPNVAPIDLDFVAPLSNPGTWCVYHGDIDGDTTDIAIINTGDGPVRFSHNTGFSVTVTLVE